MIKLTRPDGQPLYVNAKHIVLIEPAVLDADFDDPNCITEITLAGVSGLEEGIRYVRDSLDEVAALVQEDRIDYVLQHLSALLGENKALRDENVVLQEDRNVWRARARNRLRKIEDLGAELDEAKKRAATKGD